MGPTRRAEEKSKKWELLYATDKMPEAESRDPGIENKNEALRLLDRS